MSDYNDCGNYKITISVPGLFRSTTFTMESAIQELYTKVCDLETKIYDLQQELEDLRSSEE